MAQAGKIKRRDLDQELLALFDTFVKAGLIKYEDLSNELQDIVRNGGASGGSGGYDDTIIVGQINSLISNKADKTQLANYLHKVSDKVTQSMLDNNLLTSLGLTSSGGRSFATVADLDNYRKKSDSISVADLDGSLQARLNATDTKFTSIDNRLSTTELKILNLENDMLNVENSIALISAISGDVSGVAEAMTAMQTHINAVESVTTLNKQDIEAVESDLADLTDKVNDGLITLDNKLPETLLAPGVVAQLNKINNLEVSVEALRVGASRITGTLGQVGVIADAYGGLAGSNIVWCGVIAREAADIDAALSDGVANIFDITNNVAYVYDTADGSVPEPDSTITDYLSTTDFLTEWEYAGKFFLDVNTGEILFNNEGTLYNVYTPPVEPTVINVVIPANSSAWQAIEDPYIQKVKILVLDTTAGSRTLNKYINSEAVATVAYTDTGITIYNDTTESLTFKIIYG
ncbi:hypothetical protein [Anaerospora hongkongensis]|uniref:hypothetical protein n=1 Tax=Anaerospora hongkongensis TaxID=244830 RepID=UPI002897E049|nr:hypothetical protein [Anaerospora hongkongensis]